MLVFSYVLMTLLGFVGIFLIGLILLQRGRGGGLAGAFGGMGGQSAFGTKAGDVFTRITIGIASAWILLCAGSVLALHYSTGLRTDTSIFKQEGAGEGPRKADPNKPAPGDDTQIVPKSPDEEPKSTSPKTEAPMKEDKGEQKASDDNKKEPKTETKPAESTNEEKPATEKKPETPESSKDDSKTGDAPKEEGKSKDNPDDAQKPGDSKPDSKPESKPE